MIFRVLCKYFNAYFVDNQLFMFLSCTKYSALKYQSVKMAVHASAMKHLCSAMLFFFAQCCFNVLQWNLIVGN